MRLLLSTLIVRPGQSGSNEQYVVALATALATTQAAHELTLAVTAGNRALFAHLADRVSLREIRPVGRLRPIRILQDQFGVPRLAHRIGAQAIHYPGTIGGVLTDVPTVVTAHYALDRAHRESLGVVRLAYLGALYARSLRRARIVVVPTHALREQLCREVKLRPDRIHVVRHGVELADGRGISAARALLEANGVAQSFLLSVGNDLPHKNIRGLLQSYQIAQSLIGDMPPLVLVGRGLGDSGGFTNSALPPNVHLLGQLDHRIVLGICSLATVAVYPSLAESFGLAAAEAAVHGVPCVATDIPAHKEVLGDAARYIQPGDRDQLARALVDVLSSGTVRSALSARGLEMAGHFSWSAAAIKMWDLYQRAVEGD